MRRRARKDRDRTDRRSVKSASAPSLLQKREFCSGMRQSSTLEVRPLRTDDAATADAAHAARNELREFHGRQRKRNRDRQRARTPVLREVDQGIGRAGGGAAAAGDVYRV